MRALRVLVLLVAACSSSSSPLDNARGFTDPGGGFSPPGTLGKGAAAIAGNGLQNSGGKLAIDPTITQQRVTGTCGAGQAIQVVNQNGTVTCVAGGGNVTSGTLTSNTVPKATGASSVGDSVVTDNGTTFAIATNKLTVTESNGNSAVLGTLTADNGLRVIDTAGTGLQQTNNSLAVNIAGGTCANGQVATALGATGTLTCGNPNDNNYAGTHLEWSEEFLWGTAGNNANFGPWNIAINGTGAGFTANSGTTTRPGIVESSTGTTATGNVWYSTSTSSIDFGSYTSAEWNATLGVPTLSTSTDEYNILGGFFDTNTINQVDGCYFMYDRGNTATAPGTGTISGGDKWECWCASNSVRTGYTMDGAIVSQESFTTVNSPVAALTLPSTNIVRLRLLMTGTTRAEFWIDSGAGFTKRCDINTNIPSGSARLTGNGLWIRKSVGTTARLLDIDQMRLVLDLTAARSP